MEKYLSIVSALRVMEANCHVEKSEVVGSGLFTVRTDVMLHSPHFKHLRDVFEFVLDVECFNRLGEKTIVLNETALRDFSESLERKIDRQLKELKYEPLRRTSGEAVVFKDKLLYLRSARASKKEAGLMRLVKLHTYSKECLEKNLNLALIVHQHPRLSV